MKRVEEQIAREAVFGILPVLPGDRRYGFLDAFLEAAASEVKAGRKISGTRLKALKDASASMKAATKVLDGIIREASDGEKSTASTPNNRAGKAASTGIDYEILL